MADARPDFLDEDVAHEPIELVPGLWIRRPGDAPVRGALVVDRGESFGSGAHPTTRLAARALALRLASGPAAVLDVGCGSGVLALAARKLGATRVAACDVDGAAVERAKKNAKTNRLEVEVVQGGPEAVEGAFDLVLANLWTDALVAAAKAVAARVAGGGLLYATGATLPDAKRVVRELAKHELRPLALEAERNWAGALFLRA